MLAPLPVAPRPYPDELISSWLDRVACRYGLRGGEIAAPLFKQGGGTPRRRLDWQADAADLAAVGEVCRIPVEVLRAQDLAVAYPDWPRHWFSWEGRDGMSDPWGDLAPGFCGCCLREDVAAGRDTYIRHAWARAFGMCHRHKIPLTEACPWCGARRAFWPTLCRGRARHLCSACGHFIDQSRPRPDWRATPLDRDWVYAAPPEMPALIDLRVEAWRRAAAFEAMIAAALDGRAGGSCFSGGAQVLAFRQAVEDLAIVLRRRSRTPLSEPLEALWPLAFAALAERQAMISRIERLFALPQPAPDPPLPYDPKTIFRHLWQFDLGQLIKVEAPEGLAWITSRAVSWPRWLHDRLTLALAAKTGRDRLRASRWEPKERQAKPDKPGARPARPHGGNSLPRSLRNDNGALSTVGSYRGMADAILASEEWQSSSRQPVAVRRRLLNRLMRRALAGETCWESGPPEAHPEKSPGNLGEKSTDPGRNSIEPG